MKNSYDFDLVMAYDFKENNVATLWEFEITGSDEITRFANLRVIAKTMKRIIKFFDVDVSLGLAPALLCESRNRTQITLCRTC